MNIRLCFVIVLVIVFGIACKSKKTGHTDRTGHSKASRNEAKQLSKKLNLEVSDDDNIKLYSFIAEWLGTKHAMGKCAKSGVDCSCFVRLLYDEVYQKQIPRTAHEMHVTSKQLERKALKEGDVVFFSIKSTKASHVGVYLKDGWFAHVSTSKGVMINNLSEKYYREYYVGAGRL